MELQKNKNKCFFKYRTEKSHKFIGQICPTLSMKYQKTDQ